MKSEPMSHITSVSQIDNAAVITFDDAETVIYPANVLQATKEIANAMYVADLPLQHRPNPDKE